MSASNQPSEKPSGSGSDDDSLLFKFEEILDHQGPIKRKHDPNYRGSTYNLLVKWENRENTWEALHVIAEDAPLWVAKYGKAHNLLDQPGWKQLKDRLQKLARQKLSAKSLKPEMDGDELSKVEAHNHTLVGTIIQKEFDDGYYEGQVTKYDKENKLFRVDYLDSDNEEMTINSVKKYRKQVQAFDLDLLLHDMACDDQSKYDSDATSDDHPVPVRVIEFQASEWSTSDLDGSTSDSNATSNDHPIPVQETEFPCVASELPTSDLDGSTSDSNATSNDHPIPVQETEFPCVASELPTSDLDGSRFDSDATSNDHPVLVQETEFPCVASELPTSDLDGSRFDSDATSNDHPVPVQETEFPCVTSEWPTSDLNGSKCDSDATSMPTPTMYGTRTGNRVYLDGSKSDSDADKETSKGGFHNKDEVERGGSKSKDRTSFCTTTMNALLKTGVMLALVGIVFAYGVGVGLFLSAF